MLEDMIKKMSLKVLFGKELNNSINELEKL